MKATTLAVIDRFEGPYAFLSNFSRMPDGLTSEHYYQAGKTDLGNEIAWVLEAPTAKVAKERGRKVTIHYNWNDPPENPLKRTVMLNVLRYKFANPALAKLLLATGDAQLIEGNWWHDQYWGDCICARHKSTPGENWLGKLLMQVRDELKENVNANNR